jgi:hypothetical protein
MSLNDLLDNLRVHAENLQELAHSLRQEAEFVKGLETKASLYGQAMAYESAAVTLLQEIKDTSGVSP